MLVYKNSNFWIRFLANLIDLLITIAFMIGMYLIIIFRKQTTNVEYVAFVLISMGFLLLYFIFFPILAFGSTFGQHICNIKMISNGKKEVRNRDILKRNILGAWYWLLIFGVYLAFFSHTDLKTVIDTKQEDRTVLDNVGIALIGTLSSNWFLLMFVNYVLLLYSKRKIALTDRASGTRVVFKKRILIVQEEEILLVPRKVTRRKITYFNQDEKENKFYE